MACRSAGAVVAEQQTGRGAHGAVGAAAPVAAALGAEALRGGGNAYDAAIVAALAETVLLPPKCGLGGDLVALVLEPGALAPEALIAVGGAPARLADATARGELTEIGAMSVGVPAAPAGYAALSARGRFPRDRLAAPAVRVAEEGFVWAPICATLGRESRELARREQPEDNVFFPNGEPLPAGEVVRLPGYGRALQAWARDGADLLTGEFGDALVERVGRSGGLLTPEDLTFGTAEWVAPASARLHDHDVWVTPSPTHGPSLLDALFEASALDPVSLWHATQAAIRRRRATLGDPRDSGTSMVTAVDGDGTVVVVVHSNSYPRFGSGLVVEAYDLILNNRAGRGFTSVPDHPNFPAPGQRPATTLMAWAAGPAGGPPSHLGATPGGANQMTWNAQTVARLLAGDTDPGSLVTSPRWEWLPEHDGVRVEEDLPAEVRAGLAAAARRVETVGQWGLRCAHQVALRPEPGSPRVLAVDPRTGGLAIPV